ncbi:DUF29 domain-containing protein [Trinickia sp.]|uniref:DUF29 domain-containing protein n=1 Tax=Trinickia sp. TaxID=2571163 RepID=UPI003F7EFB72
MGTTYDEDVVLWAEEQATLLRAGELSRIDIEHIAEEIEDVAKSETREVMNRMAVLLTRLLEWRFVTGRRCASKQRGIKAERQHVAYLLAQAPSLTQKLAVPDCMGLMWAKALAEVVSDTGLGGFPETCPWSMAQVLDAGFMPD